MTSSGEGNLTRHCVFVQLSRDTIKRISFEALNDSALLLIKDSIERDTGLPSDIYRLKCGLHWVTDDNSSIVLKPGGVGTFIQLVLDEQWQSLYDVATSDTDVNTILRVCHLNSATTGQEEDESRDVKFDSSLDTSDTIEQSDIYRLFVALCVMCRLPRPNVHVITQVARIGGRRVLLQRTSLGRSFIDMCRLSPSLLDNEMILQLTTDGSRTQGQGHYQINETKRRQGHPHKIELYPSSTQLSPVCTARHNPANITPQGSEVKVRRSVEKVKVTLLSTRAQSAQYYRTSFHSVYDDDPTDASLPAPRPTTAGPRHRPWKTWLNEQQTQAKELKSTDSKAYEDWLKSKQHLEYRKRQEQLNALNATRRCQDNDEQAQRQLAARNIFLHQFLRKKNERLLGLDKGIEVRVGVANDHSTITNGGATARSVTRVGVVNLMGVANTASRQSPKSAVNRHVGIFEIGFHGSDDVMVVPVPASKAPSKSASGEYKTWRVAKEQFETLPATRNNKDVRVIRTSSELESVRKKLLLDGITYEEWLGYKDMARHVERVQSAN